MGLFFADDEKHIEGVRAVGFPRYRQLLEHNFKEFFLVGFIALALMIPYGLGMAYALLSKSILVMLLSGIAGGAVAGPGIACMYDLILRRLRDDKSDWWYCFKKSLKQNWKAAILPGIVQCVFLGFLIFSCAMMWWAQRPLSFGSLAVLALSAVFFLAVLSVWWPQVVLFEQKTPTRLKNAVGFILFHPGRGLGAALLQAAWWLIAFLFLPWSAFLVPFLNVWYILFLAMFILYRPMNEAFQIEEQIEERFPGQIQIGDED